MWFAKLGDPCNGPLGPSPADLRDATPCELFEPDFTSTLQTLAWMRTARRQPVNLYQMDSSHHEPAA